MLQRLRLPRTFDRDLRPLSYAMSIRRVTMGYVMILRSIYLALLGFSPVEIGLLLSIGTFVSALHHISFGVLSDRYGRKPFLVMGGVFAALRLVIFAISRDFWMLAFGEGIGAMGEGAGAGQPVVSGYITDKTKHEERGQVFSYLLIPAVVKRWGEIPPLVASRFITAGLAVALSMVTSFPVAAVLLVVLRVAMMFTMPIRQSFATGIVASRDVAKVIGISNFARMGLRTVAPTVAGYMFEAISPAMPFLSSALFVVANGLLYRTWFRPEREPRT